MLRYRCLFCRRKPPFTLQLTLNNYAQIQAYSTSSTDVTADLPQVRNIGIIAHIDAGKTTTTERMLYYSGFSRRIGEVDEGSTIMDYLPAERARGITITSAAISFSWTSSSTSSTYTINLIDTPGHADFTFEVERSIRVLDGAVTILDGVAGVEAQTEKVWRQAGSYAIPRLIFVNKLDRVGAKFGATVREIASRLNGYPAVTQLPLYESDGKGGEEVLRGIVDVIDQRAFLWELGGDGQKIDLQDYTWLKDSHPGLYEQALAARVALVELLSEHDSVLVEEFLGCENHHKLPAESLKRSLRSLTLEGDGRIIPVLCGASFKNIGVQPLLDAITTYLPSPLDRPPTEVSYGIDSTCTLLVQSDSLVCALAFKVVHDAKRGTMVFVRVYSGNLTRTMTLYNTSLKTKERAHRLLRMYADEAVDIISIPSGHIGVIIGLKHARTGDTLVSDTPHSTSTKKLFKRSQNEPLENDNKLMHLRPIVAPPPVFFASLEPHSLSSLPSLEISLAILLREDPSLHISIDEDSGQTLLSGMGELHLEIARDRLVNDLKAKVTMGRIIIAYRELLLSSSSHIRKKLSREIAGKKAFAACTAFVTPIEEGQKPEDAEDMSLIDGNFIDIILQTHHFDAHTQIRTRSKLPPSLTTSEIIAAAVSGATAALARGPIYGLPLRNAVVTVRIDPETDLASDSTLGAIAAVARSVVSAALRDASIAAQGVGGILEPEMRVVISCDEKDLGKVVADISGSRGGHILSLDDGVDPQIRLDRRASTGEATEDVDMARVWIPSIGDTNEARSLELGTVGGRKRSIIAKVPLMEMVGYLKHLRAMTGGRGAFTMSVAGWEKVQGMRMEQCARELRGF